MYIYLQQWRAFLFFFLPARATRLNFKQENRFRSTDSLAPLERGPEKAHCFERCFRDGEFFEFSRSHGVPLSVFIGYFIVVVNRGIIAGTGKDRDRLGSAFWVNPDRALEDSSAIDRLALGVCREIRDPDSCRVTRSHSIFRGLDSKWSTVRSISVGSFLKQM